MQESDSSDNEPYSDDSLAQRIYAHILDNEEEEAIDLVDRLINVDIIVSHGKTLLHCAAEKGCAKVVLELLNHGADQTIQAEDGVEDLADALPLHYAAYYGHKKCVSKLINAQDESDLRVTMGTQDYAELTPLQEAIAAFAAYRGPIIPTDAAAQAHALKLWDNYKIQHVEGVTFYLAIIEKFIATELVTEFAADTTTDQSGDSLPFGCNLAHLAARYDIVCLFEYLFDEVIWSLHKREKLESKLSFDSDEDLPPSTQPVGPTAIHSLLCTEFNHYYFCQQHLLNNLEMINIDVQDRYNRSVIFYLAMHNNTTILEHVLQQTPALNITDVFGYSAYYYAVTHCAPEALSMLLAETKDSWSLTRLYDTDTLLHIAYQCYREFNHSPESTDIFQQLLRHQNININKRNRYGRSVLECATYDNDCAAIELIMKTTGLNPNKLVKNTGKRKRRLDLEEGCRTGLDLPKHHGNDFDDVENRVIIDTLTDIMMEDEGDNIANYEDDKDEGNAPIHQGLAEHRQGNPILLKTLLKDGRIDDQVEDARGRKALKTARNEDQEAYHLIRNAQHDHYKMSSSGGSGSEDGGDESTYKSILKLLLVELDEEDIEQNSITDEQIALDLAAINNDIDNNRTPDHVIGERYCIIHYRGINFLRDIFSHQKRRDYGKTHHENNGVHSKFSHINAKVDLDVAERTPEDEQRLNTIDQQSRMLWQHVFLQARDDVKPWWPTKGINKDGFSNFAHLVQSRYSNTACVKHSTEPQHQIEIWDEIWGKISQEVQQGMQQIPTLKKLDLQGNFFVSTAKSPQHAIRYALGKSLADINRHQRIDPRYNKDGRDKYELIGKLHYFQHSLNDYLTENPSDVLLLHKAGKISINYRLFNETEVSFIGGIAAEHHVGSIPIAYPRFDIEYDFNYHYELMGLSKKKYRYFKLGFSNCQRPSNYSLEIFDKPYHPNLQNIFDLDRQQFDRHKLLVDLINSHYQQKQKRISLKLLEPFRDLLLKEIKILFRHRGNRESFYGKKSQDIYWYKPKDTLSVSELHSYIRKNLHDRSPYRKLKNELRDQIIGFYSEKIHRIAIQQAISKGKIPIYRDPDGKFIRLPKTAAELKKKLTKGAERVKNMAKRKAESPLSQANTLNTQRLSIFGSIKKPRQQQFTGTIPLHPPRHLTLSINDVLGDGNCAVTSLPVRDRGELCLHLSKAIEQVINRHKLQEEIQEALSMEQNFLSTELQAAWKILEEKQIEYDNADRAFHSALSSYKQTFINQTLIPNNSTNKFFIQHIKKNTDFQTIFEELKQLDSIKRLKAESIINLDQQKREFLTSHAVCEFYINNVIARDKQWVGKGCLHLYGKQKGINLCIWNQQKDNDQLQFDRDYSVLGNSLNDPYSDFFHVIFMHGANHFNVVEVLSDSYQEDVAIGLAFK